MNEHLVNILLAVTDFPHNIRKPKLGAAMQDRPATCLLILPKYCIAH